MELINTVKTTGRAPLDYSSLGSVLPGVATAVSNYKAQQEALQKASGYQTLHPPQPAPPIGQPLQQMPRAGGAGGSSQLAPKSVQFSEPVQLAKQVSVQQPALKKVRVDESAPPKESPTSVDEATRILQEAKAREKSWMDRVLLVATIQKIAADPEFSTDLKNFGILAKVTPADKLKDISMEELNEIKRTIDLVIGVTDALPNIWDGVLMAAEYVEKASLIGFKKYGLAPLNGLKNVVENDRPLRRTVKRWAIENTSLQYQSPTMALLWQAPAVLYKTYAANQELINQSLAKIDASDLADEFKDL